MTNQGPTLTPSPQEQQSLQTLLQNGAFSEALALAENLLTRYPEDARLTNMLGLAQMQTGQANRAIASFERAGALAGDYPSPWINLANLLVALGRFEPAARACRTALRLELARADQATLQYILGVALSGTGDAAAAVECFREAISARPDMVQAHLALGRSLATLRRLDEAHEALTAAANTWPADLDLKRTLCDVLIELRRFDLALEHLDAAVARHPQDPGLRMTRVRALRKLGRAEAAAEEAEATARLVPQSGEAWGLVGSCQRELGNKTQAIAAYDRALALEPNNPTALVARWRIEPLPHGHDDRARIEALFAAPETAAETRAALGLVLFKADDAAGETDRAFEALRKSKAVKRAARPYDMAAVSEMFAAMKTAFAAPVPFGEMSDSALPHRPVFIVGMPRSGTSLVEQILASHSAVFGGGEFPALSTAMASLGWTGTTAGRPPTAESLAKVRRAYLDQALLYGIDRPVFTDKTPLNFRWLGFALCAFSEARVLFTLRDAGATCWSNYSHDFQGSANWFGDDLEDVAEMYRLHLDLMAFWQARFADRIATVPYEKLTEEPAAESRKLVAAAGLEWEEACLKSHETRRSVRTASALQVRRKIYTGSSEAWRRYEAHLRPMIARLDGS